MAVMGITLSCLVSVCQIGMDGWIRTLQPLSLLREVLVCRHTIFLFLRKIHHINSRGVCCSRQTPKPRSLRYAQLDERGNQKERKEKIIRMRSSACVDFLLLSLFLSLSVSLFEFDSYFARVCFAWMCLQICFRPEFDFWSSPSQLINEQLSN